MPAGKIAAIPKILMVVNNLAVDYHTFSRWIDYPVDRFVVGSVDVFITGSKAAANQLHSVLALPTHKIKVSIWYSQQRKYREVKETRFGLV